MNAKLRDDDASALDLLLDRSPTASGGDAPVFAAASVGQERVQAASKVLNLLQWMPDAEPPQDLLSRTMRLIDRSIESDPSALRNPAHSLIHTQHPHA